MSTNECVAVAVLYPWRWISIALLVISIALWLWLIWCSKRVCRDLATSEEDLASLCDRVGLFDEAAQCLRRAEQMRRRAWPLRVPPPPESGPVLAKPEAG